MSSPQLCALSVPSGVAALSVLTDLQKALDGSGPAVAPHAPSSPPRPVSDHLGDLPPGLALTIGTSGSTGSPKLAMLTAGALRASAEATHLRLGTTPVCMDLAGGFSTAAFATATAEIPAGARAYTSLVPTQLVRLLASADGCHALTRYAAVLLGGAAAPASLLARAKGFGVQVVTTYGMSETAGGCVYDGRALEVSHVHLEGDGRIRLGGETLAQGYLGEPELTARSFSTGPDGLSWFRTDDVGHLREGALVVDGRLDDLINTGGVKVVPRLVEAALVQLATITEAIVVGSPDPEWGQVVSAAVVVTQGSPTPTLDEVRDRLRGILPDHALPRRLATLPELPLLGPGKPDRAAVRTLFDLSDQPVTKSAEETSDSRARS